MSGYEYFIVRFFGKNVETDLVPKSWVVGTKLEIGSDVMCFYPSRKDYHKMGKMVQNLDSPEDSWKKYKSRILAGAADYNQGKRRLDRSYSDVNKALESQHSNLSEEDGLKAGNKQKSNEKLIILSQKAAEKELNNIPRITLEKRRSSPAHQSPTRKVESNNSFKKTKGAKKDFSNSSGSSKVTSTPKNINQSKGNSPSQKKSSTSEKESDSNSSKEEEDKIQKSSSEKTCRSQSNHSLPGTSISKDVLDEDSLNSSSQSLKEDNQSIIYKERSNCESEQSEESFVSSANTNSSKKSSSHKNSRASEKTFSKNSEHKKTERSAKRKLEFKDDDVTSKKRTCYDSIEIGDDTEEGELPNSPSGCSRQKDQVLDSAGVNYIVKYIKSLEKKIDDSQRQTFAKMELNKRSILYDVKKNKNELIQILSPSLKKIPTEESFGVTFPICTMDEFKSYDEKLAQNEDIRKTLMELIQPYCSNCEYKEATRKILLYILNKSVQEKYCGQGKSVGKENFSLTQVFRCLEVTYKSTYPSVTKDMLLTYISRWLTGAKDRNGGRKQREAQKSEKTTD